MIRCCRKGWWENRQLPPLASARVPLASDVNTPPCITQQWEKTKQWKHNFMWTVKLNLYQIQQRKHSYHKTIGISVPLVSVVNTTRYKTQQWIHTAATHIIEIYLKTQTTAHETTRLFFFSSFVSKRRQQMFSSKQKKIVVFVVIIIYARHNTFVPAFNKCPKQGSRFSIRERSGDSFSCPCGRHPEIYLSHSKRNTFVFASR